MRRLLEQIAATAELMGQEISPAAAMVMAKDLQAHPVEMVVQALGNLRRESKGRMTLAAVVEQIERLQPDGRPGADEAWAMIPRDEAATVVWTQEMAEAFGVAAPLLNEGDRIAARMAFKEAYQRIVDANRRAGVRPVWSPSLGHDANGREAAITEAVRLGRINEEQAGKLLPRRDDVGVVAHLIGGAPLRLETAKDDPVEDARTERDVIVRLVGLRATIGRTA